ncbi:MAG TPA: hypothetical protein GXX36_09380 [Clostridiaceae bacterium]|nr:hypothetical protein [Clostridiaceae bacterium]
MYSSGKKQFIFRLSSGKTLNLYHDSRLGLCLSLLTKRNFWTEPVSVQKNADRYFFADIDPEDKIHIVFQDNQGNIFYSCIENESVSTMPILSSKSNSSYDKHFFLIPMRNCVHVFYVLQHSGSYLLSHQMLENDKVLTPRVIDYVTESEYPYSVMLDKSNNLFVFYQSSDGRHLQLGCKKYNPAQGFWSDFAAITRFDGNSEYPRTIMDKDGIIHICYQRCAQKQYELIYQQKIPDRNIWTSECVIHTSASPFRDFSVLCLEGNIIVYWVRDNIIYYSFSKDSGNNWSKPARYNFPAGRQLMCIHYKSNVPYDSAKISVREIPGAFINGIKFAFIEQSPETARVSANDLKDMIVDSLNHLKGSVEELEEADRGLARDISKIEMELNKLEKEFVKYTVKLDLLQNQLNELKHFADRFEMFRRSMLNGKDEAAEIEAEMSTRAHKETNNMTEEKNE